MNPEIESYILSCQPELEQLVKDLCAIPAPSHHEEKRAEFCRNWFKNNGADNVYIDDALNVVCRCGDADRISVFMAHTDTVFPDLEPMPLKYADGKIFCPGVTDDTANLAVLMICARYFLGRKTVSGRSVLFAANSCEEGLGNLKGSRKIVSDYGDRLCELITLDRCVLNEVVTKCVGSHRYRVTVRTAGGHSFSHFGSRNAIHALAEIIAALYKIEIPVDGDSKTTFNVGLISGGTSVNTIAPQAEMLYEYRSDSLACMKIMEEKFHEIINGFRGDDLEISVEKIGDRPCAGNVDPDAQRALVSRIEDAVKTVVGKRAVHCSASTDANASLAEGIPSVCISACAGGKAHTREEWLDVSSLKDGCRLLMHLLEPYFE